MSLEDELRTELAIWKTSFYALTELANATQAKLEVAGRRRAEALLEAGRLKDIICADKTTDSKTIRVEYGVKPGTGWTLIVTDPIGDEEKLASVVAGMLNVQEAVRQDLVHTRLVQERDESRKIAADYKRYWDTAEDLVTQVGHWRDAWQEAALHNADAVAASVILQRVNDIFIAKAAGDTNEGA